MPGNVVLIGFMGAGKSTVGRALAERLHYRFFDTDEMVVTDWVPERLLQVRHEKFPIIGPAWFALAPAGRGTRFEWGEDLRPPLGKLGELGGAILRTPIERVLAESLHKLKRVCESGG